MVGSGRIRSMSLYKTRTIDSHPSVIEWLPAEHLGQMKVDSNIRPWLIGKGMLTLRLKAVCGERFVLRLVNQWTGILNPDHRLSLQSTDSAGLFRDVEMCCDNTVWVFAETVIPDSTLSLYPWLAELGDAALGETLVGLSGVERSSYEYAWLGRNESLTERALENTPLDSQGLWARRSLFSLRGGALLVQEIFLPSMGSAIPLRLGAGL